MTKCEVWCSLQFEGTHFWPNCPFSEVDYLRHPHRHIFHIKAYKLVEHNDRDVEFIMMKHRIEQFMNSMWSDHAFGAMSCEMIAEMLMIEFRLSRCEVSEDNENGAIITRL